MDNAEDDFMMVGTVHLHSKFPYSVHWKFENYHGCGYQKADIKIKSPNFIYKDSLWYLELYPNGRRNGSTVGNVELYLIRKFSFDEQLEVHYTLGIKDESGNTYASQTFKHNFKDHIGYGTSRILYRIDLYKARRKLSPNNVMTFFVTFPERKESLAISEPQKKDMTETTEDSDEEGKGILLKDLKALHLNEDGFDVIFNVENQKFHAHRFILIARCSVFASMFKHNMLEKNTGVVNIVDCSPQVFKELLSYIYTGTVEKKSTDIILNLYEASVKYNLEHLRRKCIHLIQKNISANNFCDILKVFLKHEERELLVDVMNFFTKHLKEVLLTVKWQKFLRENPIAANELLIKALK